MNLLLFAAFLFYGLFPVFARDVEITVMDHDLSLPLEGAVVRSWDGSEHFCDENGKAVIEAPDDRQVIIHAAYPGYETGRLMVAVMGNAFTVGLRLIGIMESGELIIEGTKTDSGETRVGRGVAISGQEITQSGEMGTIEDVMGAVKLLPGVGYLGPNTAQPSIRGGDPNDMKASLDGFYIFNPYHWGGNFSIFDPRMVESAQLSHGVFSSRYGHSISGLLTITSKDPSPAEIELEAGINTSAANANLSVPLRGRGGILFMARVTYYDPAFWLAGKLADNIEFLEPILEPMNMMVTAPFVRGGTVTGNYRLFDDLELKATGFWAMDGIDISTGASSSKEDMKWVTYNGFFTTNLSWNPRNDMLLKFTGGTGYHLSDLQFRTKNTINGKVFSLSSANAWYYDTLKSQFNSPYNFNTKMTLDESTLLFNIQGRLDYDWELDNGFLIAAGVQEMYNDFKADTTYQGYSEQLLGDFSIDEQAKIRGMTGLNDDAFLKENLQIRFPVESLSTIKNRLFATSGYALGEYHTPDSRFKTELGLRVDHFCLLNKDFSLQTQPSLNPRLNADFNLFKHKGFVQSFDIGAGTGFFSSINNLAFRIEENHHVDTLKTDRSWTSVLGARLELVYDIHVSIEGYYKCIFDRMYMQESITLDATETRAHFNGKGRVWGIDLMLQKMQSRFWDGWISYSYNWTKYHDPETETGWYFPEYHRYHNVNFVLNVKPTQKFIIYTRLGLASGEQIPKRSGNAPVNYPVFVYDPENSANSIFIEKYFWHSEPDDKNRSPVALDMDIKFSIFDNSNYKNRKIQFETYMAIENVLALVYIPKGNAVFNEYTGKVDTNNFEAKYGIPIPMPSFGVKVSY